jgi:hypothetical protein
MRFRVEQIYLTDEEGRIISRPGIHPMHHMVEGGTVDEVLDTFVSTDGAEIVGDVLKFPGFQAIATVKRQQVVYTLQIVPATDRLRL